MSKPTLSPQRQSVELAELVYSLSRFKNIPDFDRCTRCRHFRFYHGHVKYGCVLCPISYPTWWRKLLVIAVPSCLFEGHDE